jgi:2-C-methyl-D-erythritol 4-phosphate cytidylyltransferase/2-C-methyl-D-erythritol 2,4-cyclodiphosphate synthase
MTKTIALIVAGGKGQRLGNPLPKQYLTLAGQAVIRRTVEAFRRHPRIDAVRVVYRAKDHDLYEQALAGLDILAPVAGGAERQDSVRAGLESLVAFEPSTVLIHDAARPMVDSATIDRTLDALADHDGAIAALPVTDTLKRADGSRIETTVERAGLWRAQTPQTFHFDRILKAHRAAEGLALGDDAAVAERAGLTVALVMGHEDNLKITTSEDLVRTEQLLQSTLLDVRVGNGFDVHKFNEGAFVTLCGLQVPHTHGLEGHSDADVGLHAITDAILGAIGAGDIGQHFSPMDARWKGADSSQFLAHAASLVHERGGIVAHVDLTLICERPKIGPHRVAMVKRVAEILGLSEDRVSVKATTTEGLGFTGRQEGIAGQATATVRLPL